MDTHKVSECVDWWTYLMHVKVCCGGRDMVGCMLKCVVEDETR